MPVRLEVCAGYHDRTMCPVFAILEEKLPPGPATLIAPSGRRVPAQISACGDGVKITWIIELLLKGESLIYDLDITETEVSCRSVDSGDAVGIYIAGEHYTS